MTTKSTSPSGFLSLRAITILFCATAACSILTVPLLAFLRPQQQVNGSQRTLSFEERVSYQKAIEDVYWRHRIWPKERPDPKPSLDAVMSQTQLEKKVTDYMRNSQVLEDYWQRPITAEQLQAEMDRMATHTKQPEVLRELFEALGNDPFVIAECLARPAVAQHLIQNLSGANKSLSRNVPTAGNEAARAVLRSATKSANAAYTLSKISTPTDCAEDTWAPTSNVPDTRGFNTTIWTGSEMIIWGGSSNGTDLNTGEKYSPATDTWTTTSTINAPQGRNGHTAVWTGSEMIVWGGFGNALLNTGGRYNPATDSWTATSISNAPGPRYSHTAAWTGNEMIVWGGLSVGNYLGDGGKYNPSTDSWTATNTINEPVGRFGHTAVWTGSEMIIWGGQNFFGYLDNGGKYNLLQIAGRLPQPLMRLMPDTLTQLSGAAVR